MLFYNVSILLITPFVTVTDSANEFQLVMYYFPYISDTGNPNFALAIDVADRYIALHK